VETLLALRALLEVGAELHVVAPNRNFVYQPLAVAAPFDLAETHLLELAEIAREHEATLHEDSLEGVDTTARQIQLAIGGELAYDALMVAVGARRRDWLEGALHFGGAADVAAFRGLLERLVSGADQRLAFVGPAGVSWTLPLYELALLTASHLADLGVVGAELTVATPEADPLAAFGPAAGRMLRDLLADRGIALRTGARAQRIEHGRLCFDTDAMIEVDRVLALAELEGPALPGLPCDASGFIPVDAHSRVTGLGDVYAAGDGTTYPIKQGGIAAQQGMRRPKRSRHSSATRSSRPRRCTRSAGCCSRGSPRRTCARSRRAPRAPPSRWPSTRCGGRPARSPGATWLPTWPATTRSRATRRSPTCRPRATIRRRSGGCTTRRASWR